METLAPPSTPHGHRRHQISVLLITFCAYASFHVSRKPPSIVKSLLGPEISSPSPSSASGWPPFDGPRGPHRLGELDLAFLSAYAAGMFFAGHAGDRLDLRRLLAFGMLGSGIATAAFGLGFWLQIHRLGFYLMVQIVGGLFQSIGWPCVVAVMGNWFGKSKRGFIMGVWNSNSSVGNIVGSVIASSVLEFGWGWSFILPAILIVVLGIVVFLFLVVDPSDLESESISTEIEMGEASVGSFENGSVVNSDVNGEEIGLLRAGVSSDSDVMHAIGFVEAWRLPGVAQFAFCLFFSKLVGYTFLYWLPFYIRHTAIAGEHLSQKTAGILSAVFDVGGVFGGISAGIISDRLGARATTSFSFLLLSIPTLVLYRIYGSMSMYFNIGLMFLSGYFVNGPYALITTAVAADLGTQDTISGNSRALATVTAILDGTGSIGAALGPLLTGYISTRGWNSVFAMLIISTTLAILFLIRLVKAEISSEITNIQHIKISSVQIYSEH